jgi:hypothetical protein
MGEPVMHRGVEYSSLSDLAESFGIHPNTLKYRVVNAGMSLEDALSLDVMNNRPIRLVYKGVEYPSINSLSEECNLSEAAIRQRLHRGWSVEDAVERGSITTPRAKEVTYLGDVYQSFKALSDSLGFDYNAFMSQVRRRVTLEEAVDAYLAESRLRDLTVWGKTFKSITDTADAYGVSASSLYYHLDKKGMTPEEALVQLLKSGVTFRGKKYNSLIDLCSEYKILNSNLFSRLKVGWTLAEALTTPLDISKMRRNTPSIYYRGSSFNTKAALLRHYGIAVSLVKDFMLYNKIPLSDWLFAFDIIASFLDTCNGNRPNIVSKIPLLVYNGQWLYTAAQFCEACSIPHSHYRGSVTINRGATPFRLMELLKTKTDEKYLINGQYYGHLEVRKVFKMTPRTVLSSSSGVKVVVVHCSSIL